MSRNSTTVSLDDIPPEQRTDIRTHVTKAISENFGILDPDLAVAEIYAYGSFADGTARPGESDLDIRVIVTTTIHEDQSKQMATTVKTYVHRKLPDDTVFTHVDPQVYPKQEEPANQPVL